MLHAYKVNSIKNGNKSIIKSTRLKTRKSSKFQKLAKLKKNVKNWEII